MTRKREIKTRKFIRNLILGLLLAAFYAVVVVTASPNDSTKTAPPPAVSKAKLFVANTSWDWGYTPKVPKISHIFQIQNIGEDTLRIINVAPS